MNRLFKRASCLALLVITGCLRAQTVVGTLSRTGFNPTAVAVYEAGNRAFVADSNSGKVYIYDGSTLADLGSISAGGYVDAMLVNETAGKLYLHTGNSLRIYDATSGSLLATASGSFTNVYGNRMAQDTALGKIYVLSSEGLRQIDANSNSVTTVPVGSCCTLFDVVGLNPVTHEVFVARYLGPMEIINGTTLARTTISGLYGWVMAVNWIENKIYLSTGGGGGVPFQVLDRDTGTITGIPADNDVSGAMVFNPASNRVYTSSEVNRISTIIEGSNDSFFNLPMPSSTIALGIRRSTNHIYYAALKFVAVLDDTTQTLEHIPINNPAADNGGIIVSAVAINQTTGRVFVINDARAGIVTVVQDTDGMTRPPVFLTNSDFFCNVLVLDPVAKQLVTYWDEDGFQAAHNAAVRPGGGRLLVPRVDLFRPRLEVWAGTGEEISIEPATAGTGGNEPRAVGGSPDRTRVYVTNSGSNNVGVLNTSDYSLVKTISVGTRPWGIAITPDGSKVYIANQGQGTVSVLNTANDSVSKTVTVGSSPWGIAIVPSSTKVYVANSGANSLSVLDSQTDTVIKTVSVGSLPTWLSVSPDGKTVFVVNRNGGSISVVDTGSDVVVRTIPISGTPGNLAFVPDGSEVYVAIDSSAGPGAVAVVKTADYSIQTITLPNEQFHPNARALESVAIADMTARFAGRVSAGGTALNGATVRVLQGGVVRGSAITNASGDYCIHNLLAGTYDVETPGGGSFTGQTLAGQKVDSGQTAVRHFNLASSSPPVLRVAKTHNGNFAPGQNGATYSVTVSNAPGAGVTSGTVAVSETIPAGLMLVSMAGPGWTCPAGGNTCTRGDSLGASLSYPSITVTVNVAGDATSPQINTVGVSGGGSANATASDSTTISSSSGHNPLVSALSPVASSGTNQTLTFQFTDPDGWQDLNVLNVLINDYLDGRTACYLAYVRQSNTLFLVNDTGDAGGPYAGNMILNGSASSISNSQCTIGGAGSSANGSGNTLTLTLDLSFSSGFRGNRVIYAAARDTSLNNSGWQTMGAHGVPPLPSTFPNPVSMSPSSGSGLTLTPTFTYQDQNTATNLQTVWVLINTAIDGRGACYVAYYRPGNQLFPRWRYIVQNAASAQLPDGRPYGRYPKSLTSAISA